MTITLYCWHNVDKPILFSRPSKKACIVVIIITVYNLHVPIFYSIFVSVFFTFPLFLFLLV